eukprot:2609966-Alexandrium_andersonii.AAC.1
MLADCVAVVVIHGVLGAPFGAGRLLVRERSASQPAARGCTVACICGVGVIVAAGQVRAGRAKVCARVCKKNWES